MELLYLAYPWRVQWVPAQHDWDGCFKWRREQEPYSSALWYVDSLDSFTIQHQPIFLYSSTEGISVSWFGSDFFSNCAWDFFHSKSYSHNKSYYIPKSTLNSIWFLLQRWKLSSEMSLSCRHLQVLPQRVLLEKRCHRCQHSEGWKDSEVVWGPKAAQLLCKLFAVCLRGLKSGPNRAAERRHLGRKERSAQRTVIRWRHTGV